MTPTSGGAAHFISRMRSRLTFAILTEREVQDIRLHLKDAGVAQELGSALSLDVESSALAGKLSKPMFETVAKTAELIWKCGNRDAALDLITTLVLSDVKTSPPTWLRELADIFPSLKGVTLIRAANLLRRYPSKTWLSNLKTCWLEMEDKIQLDYDRRINESCTWRMQNTNLDFLHSAAAVLAAMGVCAASDRDYSSVEDRDPSLPELEQLIDRRNKLFERHRDLERQYHLASDVGESGGRQGAISLRFQKEPHHADDSELRELLRRRGIVLSPESFRPVHNDPWKLPRNDRGRDQAVETHNRIRAKEIESEIIQLREALHGLDGQIKEKRKGLRPKISAGRLLLLTLRDEQTFSSVVRQSAAWGLWTLCRDGNLDATSRAKILAFLQESIRNRDDDALRESVDRLDLSRDLAEKIATEAMEFVNDADSPQVSGWLDRLGLSGDLREKITNIIRTFRSEASPSRHFQERTVLFSRGQRFLELAQEISDAIVWVSELIESRQNPDLRRADHETVTKSVRCVLAEICIHVPSAYAFFEQCPLRLMTAQQHRRVLANFSRKRAEITMWTRYTPPLWQRDLPPEKVGVVRSRYLELDDRSGPNAMGIRWQLLRNPLLAAPVLYHEFMHYGGPSGEPNRAILNECEVHLREAIFARGLVARMAPVRDSEIASYEHRIVQTLEEHDGMLLISLLLMDFRTEDSLNRLNSYIQRVYGPRMRPVEATEEVNHITAYYNQSIAMANATDERKTNWQPDIQWPYLNAGHGDAVGITLRFEGVILQDLTTTHWLDRAGCNRVLNDPALQSFCAEWTSYAGRPFALKVLADAVNSRMV